MGWGGGTRDLAAAAASGTAPEGEHVSQASTCADMASPQVRVGGTVTLIRPRSVSQALNIPAKCSLADFEKIMAGLTNTTPTAEIVNAFKVFDKQVRGASSWNCMHLCYLGQCRGGRGRAAGGMVGDAARRPGG